MGYFIIFSFTVLSFLCHSVGANNSLCLLDMYVVPETVISPLYNHSPPEIIQNYKLLI